MSLCNLSIPSFANRVSWNERSRSSVSPRMMKINLSFKLIMVGCVASLAASPALSPALAQGGGGFGLTLGAQNAGPRYPGDEERDVGGCVWRRQWIIDERGRRVLRRIRICF